MKQYSIFDIVGPDMIGPSSSHTAGAARIGYMAMKIFGHPIESAVFYLHGSFAATYKGHGTDLALLAGLMGIRHNDEQIRDAYILADKAFSYTFVESDEEMLHPNTVTIEMHSKNHTSRVQGCSIGGGNAIITKIDDIDVSIDGAYHILITVHKDQPGMVNKLTEVLTKENINIAFMKLYRERKGERGIMVLEMDEGVDKTALARLMRIEDVYKTTYIPKGGF